MRGLLGAAVTLAALTATKLYFDEQIGWPTPFLLYFAAIVVGAWRGGLHVGLAATAMASGLGLYFFVARHDGFGAPHGRAAAQVAAFVVEGVILSVVTARAGADRRRAHDSAREQRAAAQKLQAVLDGVDDGIVVQDATGRMLYANEVAARLLGVDRADKLRGAGPSDDTGRLEILDEAGEPLALDQMPGRNAIRTRSVVERELLFRVRATGDARWTAVRSKPVLDAEGHAGTVISVLRDVTERRRDDARRVFIARATQELASSLDYAETLARVARLAVPDIADCAAVDLVEGAPLALAHSDPARGALARATWPSRPSDATDTREPTLIADLSAAEVEAAARDPEHLAALRALGLRSLLVVPLVARGQTIGALTFATAESGRRFGPDDLALATRLADRAAVAIEHARLLREAERARAEAELANRSKDEFLAMLGHELRNPLAPILTALAILRMRGGPEPGRELAVIERQVKHLVRLVDDLLDVSRITRGRVELDLQRLALADVVARAAEMAMPLIEQRAHRLEVDVPAGLTVRGDPVRLAQVVANLLNNAAKYTEKGGLIAVGAGRVGASIELRVRDRGIGITAAMLPRVFDLFAQESQAIDRAQGGLGLGLAIVKSLVTLHGGEVTASSGGLGEGSEFCVRLPALDDGAASLAPATAPVASAGASRRVLVVDDNEDAADLLADALVALGHTVRKAHDGPSALVLAPDFHPEVALLDIGLPVMDGHELGRRLRALDGLGDLRLVAVTGYGQESDRQRSAAAGFDDHLVKPVDPAALPAIIARLTGG